MKKVRKNFINHLIEKFEKKNLIPKMKKIYSLQRIRIVLLRATIPMVIAL